jgi:hypothetical protein
MPRACHWFGKVVGWRADCHKRQVCGDGVAYRDTAGPLPIGKDDFLRGHFEFQFPLAQDFLVAANFFHDFEAVGGFRNDIGVEIRLAKLFYPRPASK